MAPVAIAIFIFFWNMAGLGLSHWDEFNYLETASWFLRIPGNAFTIYEPPGFPFAVSLFFRLFGIRDYVAISVSAAFAVLTVALIGFFALRCFGTGVGFAVPIMLTVMPLFITYGRMALTDMMFTFFYTLTIFTWYQLIYSRGVGWWVLACVAFSGCVMTKYNGFMPALVFATYLALNFRNLRAEERVRAANRRISAFVLSFVPAAVLSLLFIAILGVSTLIPESHVFSAHALKLVVFDAPQILGKGFAKFEAAAVLPHGGQLGITPLIAAPYYLQVLAYFIPVPILILAVIGLCSINLRQGSELLVGVWLMGTFLLVSSVPAHYSRAILPVLPPMALAAALGFIQS